MLGWRRKNGKAKKERKRDGIIDERKVRQDIRKTTYILKHVQIACVS